MLNVFDLLNLDGKNVEDKIVQSIEEVKEELKDLDTERMCKVYSGHLYQKLRDKHVMCRLIDTKDLGIDYQHQFILVLEKENSYFLVDLTYEQFGDDEFLHELLDKGYEKVDSLKWAYYMSKFDFYGVPLMNDVFNGGYLNKKSVKK